MNWLDLFNSSSTKYQTDQVVFKKCKGHYIICDMTTPCFVDTQYDYCHQHKARYRFNKPEDCPVCYEEMGDIPIPLECGHWIHRECMSKSMKPVCPICRKNIHIEDILYFMGKEYKDKMDKIDESASPSSGPVDTEQPRQPEQPRSNLESFPNTDDHATFVRFIQTIISTINPMHIELIDTLRNIENSSRTMNLVDLFGHRLNIAIALPTELFDQLNWETTFLTNINNNTILNKYNSIRNQRNQRNIINIRNIRNRRNQRNIDNTVLTKQRSWFGFIKYICNSILCTRFNV